MKTLILGILLIVLTAPAQACPSSPLREVARTLQGYVSRSDVAFLGKLESEQIENGYIQTATFRVRESYTPVLKNGQQVVIKNYQNSSCSAIFGPVGTDYYVFPRTDEAGDFYISMSATFTPKSMADEAGVRPIRIRTRPDIRRYP